jgi:hypothetical protein
MEPAERPASYPDAPCRFLIENKITIMAMAFYGFARRASPA